MASTPELVEGALQAGEMILRLLQGPLTEQGFAQIDGAVAEREERLRAALEAMASGQGSWPTAEAMGRLNAQQRALEEQGRLVMAGMGAASGDAQKSRASIQSVHRILNPGVRSRLVDERR